MKTLVEHRFFQRGILTAILINTLSMGIEYHNQVLLSEKSFSLFVQYKKKQIFGLTTTSQV